MLAFPPRPCLQISTLSQVLSLRTQPSVQFLPQFPASLIRWFVAFKFARAEDLNADHKKLVALIACAMQRAWLAQEEGEPHHAVLQRMHLHAVLRPARRDLPSWAGPAAGDLLVGL